MFLSATRIIEMMSFAMKALGPTPSSGYSVRIIDKAGANFRTASAEEAKALAEKKQIVGKGSESNLKYAVLTVDPTEARATIDETNSPPLSIRAKKLGLRIPIAEDNFTIRRVNEPTGQYFEHRNDVCATYAR
jgi:hypothetical protein